VITVVGFSPAIDVTYFVEKLIPGSAHKVSQKFSIAGGKSVNVANVLSTLETSCQLVIPLGGETGNTILNDLQRRKINTFHQPISAVTRACVAVVDERATVFNEPATVLTDDEYDQFENLIIRHAASSKAVVFSGSMPANYSPDRFQAFVEKMKTSDNQVIVDTSGDYLLAGARAKADLVKPNHEELAAAFPGVSQTAALAALIELGAGSVYLSMGSLGGLFQSAERAFGVEVPEVKGNATGAGDAFVAGFASAIDKDLTLSQALVLASACGTAAVLEDTGGIVELDKVENFKSKIRVLQK
jgi:1-phosphofructokinase family hexose kinase